LRNCWSSLDWLAEETRKAGPESNQARNAWNTLVENHQAALDIMIASGQFDTLVAREMQRAFEEAATHIKNTNKAVVTCYEISDVDVLSTQPANNSIDVVRNNLVRQAELLQEFSVDITSTTIERAQEAIALDITFLEIALRSSSREELFKEYQAGGMDINPKALETAQLLVDIILDD
jgi:hypothetical protein